MCVYGGMNVCLLQREKERLRDSENRYVFNGMFGSAEVINVISGRRKFGSQGNQRRKSWGGGEIK